MSSSTPSTAHQAVVVTPSVSEVRGLRFSEALRETAARERLELSLPPGATIAFHNTEYSPLMALIPFLGTDRVPTKRDRASIEFDWSKTGLINDITCKDMSELPDRGPAMTFGGFEIGRESLTKWFDRIREALPSAIDDAKFLNSHRDTYRLAGMGKVVNALLRHHGLLIDSGRYSGVYVLGNGYPDFVVDSYQALMVVARDGAHLEQQCQVLCEELGGKLQETAIIKGGKLISLGKSELYLLTEEGRSSIRLEGSRYDRAPLATSRCTYLCFPGASSIAALRENPEMPSA